MLSFITTFWAGVKYKLMQLVTLIFHVSVCIQTIKQEKVYTHGELKLIHINLSFQIASNSYIFKIYQKQLFLCGKTKNWKYLYWFFSSKKNVTTKWHLSSENLSFQNLLKLRKLFPDEEFGDILTCDKEFLKKV